MKRSAARIAAVLGAGVMAASLLAGCGSSGDSASGSGNTIKVVYQKTKSFTGMDTLMKKVKTEYEKKYPDRTVKLVPIEAEQDQYFTKLALMNGSASTAGDVIYEDTFQIRSDAAAGYLQPIDQYINKWSDWSKFFDNAKQAGKGDDGKLYGVSTGTDTRGLYFNKEVFAKAGLPENWAPKNWNDIITAAKTIKEKVPGVIPFDIPTGKARGEETSMQGFEMLLYGTNDQLTNSSGKWVTGSKGYQDALKFYQSIYSQKLGPDPSQALDTSWGNKSSNELFPKGKIGIMLSGSWIPSTYITQKDIWPNWQDQLGMAPMPTQNGQEPGATSMSGGWTLAVGSHCKDPQAAVDLIEMSMTAENAKQYYMDAGQIAVRSDVADDKEYLAANPTFGFFSSLVKYTHFRPATPDYSQISSNIAVSTESVATGQQTPAQAQATYDKALIGIVGKDKTAAAKD